MCQRCQIQKMRKWATSALGTGGSSCLEPVVLAQGFVRGNKGCDGGSLSILRHHTHTHAHTLRILCIVPEDATMHKLTYTSQNSGQPERTFF